MSQENVDAVHAAIAAYHRRDVGTLQALLAKDAEIVPIRAQLEGTSYAGPDAVARWFAAVDESWSNLTVEVEEIRDGGDRVLCLGRIRGHGRGSGVAIDVEAAMLARFRGRLITSLRMFSNRAEALEVAGLSE